MPDIRIPQAVNHPVVACTPDELARLKAAYAQSGPTHDVVAQVVSQADKALRKPVNFPPRGGQHNQWYQCEACQIGLKTVDDTHHQCPRCRKIYTGEPYDDVIFSRIHSSNLKGAETAAWAYAITGKKAYAEHAAKVLLGYAQRYRGYPLHSSDLRQGKQARSSGGHLGEQTLGEASDLAGLIAPAFDLIHDSDALSNQDRAAIRNDLIVPMLQTIDRSKAGKGNWQTWHNAAMLWGGAVIGDAAWIQKAIADPKNGFAYQMTVSVSSDGLWYENSWGYHFYTLHAMVLIAQGARRLGIDVWSHPTLRKMFTLAPRYAMANGQLPRFGDDVRTSASSGGSLLEAAYQATQDPLIGAQLRSTPSWDSVLLGRPMGQRLSAPVRGSELFPGAGHAVLRTAGPAGLTAAFTFGPYGGFHGHFDKLSFVFFGYGKELAVDPGRAASQAYRLPVHKLWYKSTLSHNAVLVDGAAQEPATGKLELFAATNSYAAVSASCDEAYPGVKHRRWLVMTPTYLLVLDDLRSGRDRRFDWLYHNRGASLRCLQADKPGQLPDPFSGKEFINNLRSGATDQGVNVEFVGQDITTHLSVAAENGTKILTGDGVGESVLDRVPLTMITRQGRSTLFAAALEPTAKGAPPTIKGVTAQRTAEGVLISIQLAAMTDQLKLTPDGQLKLSSGAQVLLQGRPVSAP